jgi:hypothetical protein
MTIMLKRVRMLLASAVLIPLLLSACARVAPAHSSGASHPPAATTAPKIGTEGGEGGAEAALVRYTDAAQGFSIAYPGPWTQDKSTITGVQFKGGDDRMTLEFVTPPAGTSAITYATSDVAAVKAAYPGFKQVGLAPSTEVSNAVVLGIQATGVSTVTGKTYDSRGDRYYLPLPDGRIAVLTVIGPSSHYDRESIRDIALTFKLTH